MSTIPGVRVTERGGNRAPVLRLGERVIYGGAIYRVARVGDASADLRLESSPRREYEEFVANAGKKDERVIAFMRPAEQTWIRGISIRSFLERAPE